MLEHGAKAANSYNQLIRETKPVEGKPTKLRAFAVGTCKSKGVVLVAKRKPMGASLDLVKMTKKQGSVTPLAHGYLEWDEGEIKLKCVKAASESAVRKAFLEYYSEYKVSPPSKKIVLLQPSEWSLEEAESKAEEEGEEETDEEGVSDPSKVEGVADNAFAAALAKLQAAVDAGILEVSTIAENLMKQSGHSAETDGPLDFSRIKKLLSRHIEAFKTRAETEGAGCAPAIHAELQNDVNRLKLAAATPRLLEQLVGQEKQAGGVSPKDWQSAQENALSNIGKLVDAINADFANAEPAVKSAVSSALPRLEEVLGPLARFDLVEALQGLEKKPEKEKAAELVKVRQLKKKYDDALGAKEIALIDANPFQVPVDLKGILGGGLKALEKGLADLEKSLPK